MLFLDCLLELLSDDQGVNPLSNLSDSGLFRSCFVVLATILLTTLNYRGLDIVGNVSLGICLFSLSPFVIFCVLGLPKVQPSRWLVAPPGGMQNVDWKLLLNTFFWNINFWESAASFSGEVVCFVDSIYCISIM